MKKVNFIFKLLIFLLLIASIGFIASCEKHPFVEKPMYFQGTCKILQYNQEGDWNGKATFIATDTTDIKGIDFSIKACDQMGGTFILNNDSNGRMCYTCQTQKWWSN
jgi:hypothetical protein